VSDARLLARRRIALLAPGPAADAETDRLLRRLAVLAAAAGAEALLLTPEAAMPAPGWSDPVRRIACATPSDQAMHGAPCFRAALGVMAALRPLHPDLVIAPEAAGLAFAMAQLRRLGLGFTATRLLVLCTGPRGFRAALDGRPPGGRDDLALDHLERCSLAWADAAVLPGPVLEEWMRAEAWALPATLRRLAPPAPALPPASAQRVAASEILFVGDFRRGAGLPLFVAALRRLSPERRAALRVTLLGAQPRDSWAWEAGPWLAGAMPPDIAWAIEAPPATEAALAARLARPGSLVVMPGSLPPGEAARLCRALGVTVLAPDLPGWRALLHEGAQAGLLAQRPDAFAAAIECHAAAALAGEDPDPDAFAPADTWQSLLAETLRLHLPGPAEPGPPDGAALSVVLTHHNRPDLLAQALDGLRAQTLEGFEVVLVDDGSDQPEALAALDALEPDFAARGWRILHAAHGWSTHARNIGWRAARGRFVLFHDDDNVALPHQLATMLAAARHSGAAVISCFPAWFSGAAPPEEDPAHPPFQLGMLGGALALGMFENCLGDMHAMIRRDALEAMGGLEVVYGIGHEDWTFFARLALAGQEVLAVPEALYRYRLGAGSITGARADHEPAFRRSLGPFAALLPPVLRPALELGAADARRLAVARIELAQLRTALAAAEAGRDAAEARQAAEAGRAAAAEQALDAIAAALRAEAEAVTASRSMRLAQRLRGRTVPEATALPPEEELARLRALRGSVSWEAMAPLRLAARLFRRGTERR
jgi:hypothetical protein